MRTLLLLLAVVAPSEYRQAVPGYGFSFPRDHFEHRDFRTEWWYYTGNVRSAEGRRFGFELVFFRQGQRRGPSNNQSAWRIDDLYLAHMALTDVDRGQFHYFKRLNRAGPGIAGASFEQQQIWNGNWSAQWKNDEQILEARAEQVRFRLRLALAKPPVIHGENGVSQKASGRGQASHYVSFTRLTAEGEIFTGQQTHPVRGTAWMDHEWFTHQLEESQQGWDWFSIQLDNGSELMLFELRRKDGAIDPHSAGTHVNAHGGSRRLTARDFKLQPLEFWKSPKTGARYPIRWKIEVPSLSLALECSALVATQELVSADSSGPSYWEGAVRYTGTTSGVGYLEMTGYDRPVRLD